MPKRHAARPRLVVDNNSASDNSTPRSRASRSKSKCHSPGITSRTDHIPTPLRDIPGSRDASSAGPPKRSTIPETEIDSVTSVSIGKILATNGGQGQARNMAGLKNADDSRRLDHYLLPRDRMTMSKKGTLNVTPATREMMGRILDLRLGKTEITPFAGREMNQTEFAKGFGAKKTTYGQWERSVVAPPCWAIINFAIAYNLSLDFLMRGMGPPQPPHVFPGPTEDAIPPAPAKAVSRKTKKQKMA